MSLRTKLWLVLGAIFLIPLIVGALVLALVVPDIQSDRQEAEVRAAGVAAADRISETCLLLGLAARSVGQDAVSGSAQSAVRGAVERGYADYAAVLEANGNVLASEGRLPGDGGPGALVSCASGGVNRGLVAERASIDGTGPERTAVVATVLDPGRLRSFGSGTGLGGDTLLLDGSQVMASTADPGTSREVVAAIGDRSGLVDVEGRKAMVVRPRPGDPAMTVVVVADGDGMDVGPTLLFGGVFLAAAVAALLLVTMVARGLSQPFRDLTEAAERVADGDLDTRITTSREDEVGRLGDAFNLMTSRLRRNMSALEQSRGDLRDSLERIGDTLMSTHDLEGLLQVVLETAALTLQAQAGVVLHGSPDQLHLVAEHGLGEAGLVAPTTVRSGDGVLGRVVSTGDMVRGRIGSGPRALTPAPGEPAEGEILAVALRSMGQVLGVLALYDRVDGEPFDDADADALRTLAGQAGIAIDNVQLHQEAQRLSTTDALTGLWNFRYLSMSLAREIERSTRFDRPLAVLMLDLDHFKDVNDAYGHAVGDSVLRELAQRVHEQIREVDTFARYGGEEFVVVLPETTVEGAAQLAERICVALRRTPVHVDGADELTVTVSIGGAAFPTHGSSAATLMRAADKALYVAKHEGRDRWHVPAS